MYYMELPEDTGEIDDYEEDDDDDGGISFEKYAELSARMNGIDNLEAQYKIVENNGYSREDWDFYKKVWTVEMANPEKLKQYKELYEKALNNI
jgi:hypothetical protein